MNAIDKVKLGQLRIDWILHERWVQNIRPDRESAPHELRMPGYEFLAGQAMEAYNFYRHSFAPFFAQIEGDSALFTDLQKLILHLRSVASHETANLFVFHSSQYEHFHSQWGNLFETEILRDGVSHELLLLYQRKYEVEFPLRFLLHLHQIESGRSFDPTLTQFVDHGGRLKKGKVVDALKRAFRHYPNLRDAITVAYNSKLRNAIAHNSYVLNNGKVEALDGSLTISESEFIQSFYALQTLQNALVGCSYLKLRTTHA